MVELIDKAFDLLERVAQDAPCSLRDLSDDCRIPPSTAHRIVTTLVSRGYLVAERRGRYHLGPAWHHVVRNNSLTSLLAAVSRGPLAGLARAARVHTHLGVMEDGMVTYLVKQRYGRSHVYSAENMQLEAYCTAIGKCLLAQLEPTELDAYFESAPFIPLTPATITDPEEIRTHLVQIRAQGWAAEIEESLPGMMCLSVPIRAPIIGVYAAISVSIIDPCLMRKTLLDRLPALLDTREAIERKLLNKGRQDKPFERQFLSWPDAASLNDRIS